MVSFRECPREMFTTLHHKVNRETISHVKWLWTGRLDRISSETIHHIEMMVSDMSWEGNSRWIWTKRRLWTSTLNEKIYPQYHSFWCHWFLYTKCPLMAPYCFDFIILNNHFYTYVFKTRMIFVQCPIFLACIYVALIDWT